MSRGASGEAAGRLVEEKVGVTAGIVTGPQKHTIDSIRGVEGMYKLLSEGTEAEKEAFIDKCQGF